MIFVYVLIVFVATLIGSASGLGGGVIIKPCLDFIAYHDLRNIAFLSASSVFLMSVYSTFRHLIAGTKIDFKLIANISLGSILGGKLGHQFFDYTLKYFPEGQVKKAQSLFLSIALIFVLWSVIREVHIESKKSILLTFLIGAVLGSMSSFLGIGGGPINVAVYLLFFTTDMKKASVYSLATILFAQATNLASIGIQTGFESYDLSFLKFMLPSALIGAECGTWLNKELSEKSIRTLFLLAIFILILLNTFNFIFK